MVMSHYLLLKRVFLTAAIRQPFAFKGACGDALVAIEWIFFAIFWPSFETLVV
jgi:hypothetical protein